MPLSAIVAGAVHMPEFRANTTPRAFEQNADSGRKNPTHAVLPPPTAADPVHSACEQPEHAGVAHAAHPSSAADPPAGVQEQPADCEEAAGGIGAAEDEQPPVGEAGAVQAMPTHALCGP